MLGADFTSPLRGRSVHQHRLQGFTGHRRSRPQILGLLDAAVGFGGAIRNNVDNADANDDSPNSSMGTSASDPTTRWSIAAQRRLNVSQTKAVSVRSAADPSNDSASNASSSAVNTAMRLEPATESYFEH